MSNNEGAGAGGKGLPAYSSSGQSDATLNAKNDAKNNWEGFADWALTTHNILYAKKWNDVLPTILCNDQVYKELASYFFRVRKNLITDADLQYSTIETYLRQLLNLAREKFGLLAEHRSFFEGVERRDSWLKGVLRNLQRDCLKRVIKGGKDTLVSQATPIYREDLQNVARSLNARDNRTDMQLC